MGISKNPPNEGDPLTKREDEVLAHIRQGLSNPQIAQALGLSVYTVGEHVRGIFIKRGVCNRVDAALGRGKHSRPRKVAPAKPAIPKPQYGDVIVKRTKASQVRAQISGPNSVFNQAAWV